MTTIDVEELDDDAFCIYCQREFANHENLVRHIKKQHPGTYAFQSYVTKEPLP